MGTMGGALALLFADNGVDVSIHDTSASSLEKTVKNAEAAGLSSRIHVCHDHGALCQSLGDRKVFIFSLPNGRPGDAVVERLGQYVTEGDIVIDGSNENYKVTQARQEILRPYGASYVGLGISGGSFGARNGPSLMPGGDHSAVELILPILTRIAARDDQGRPCVTNIGAGGSGHFVKMIHNGIEHGIMSALCEAWEIMDKCLEMDGDRIADVFDSWYTEGELVCFHDRVTSGASCVNNSMCREATFWSPSVVRSAAPRTRRMGRPFCTRSGMPWSRTRMGLKEPECGPTWKPWHLMYRPRA